MPSKYISYTLVLFFVTVFTLQLDQLIYKKLRFIQIFNRRTFILESSNILQCAYSVKATSFFLTELLFRKPNHINTTLVVVCREINIITQSRTPPGSVCQSHQQCLSQLLRSEKVCRS